MKIRNGFVSNSSSASYIVKIHGIDYKDFINKIFDDYSWSYFNKQELAEITQRRLENNAIYQKEMLDEKEHAFRFVWFRDLETKIKKDAELLEKIDTMTNKEIVEEVLDRSGIKIKSNENGIKIVSGTVMHNDFATGMSKILQEIILYFMFNTSHKMECVKKDDQ